MSGPCPLFRRPPCPLTSASEASSDTRDWICGLDVGGAVPSWFKPSPSVFPVSQLPALRVADGSILVFQDAKGQMSPTRGRLLAPAESR